jgi:SPP1 family phage portal protein
MELTDIIKLIATPKDLVEKVKKFQVDLNSAEALKQLEPEGHAVMDPAQRKDKQVVKPTGLFDADDKPIYGPSIERVARIPVALQKLIVTRAATFLTGNPVELEATTETELEEKLLAMLKKTWLDNKLDYKTRPIAKCMMSEKECVELWHLEEAVPGYWGTLGNPQSKLKMRFTILKPSEGNVFYPVYNNYGDLTAFGRGYKIKVEDKEQERLDLYTPEAIYKFYHTDQGWKMEEPQINGFGKIPLIYYPQPRTEWADVQWAIDRLEKLLSNFADTNDYFGSPMVVSKGTVLGFASKGESGKMLQLEGQESEVKYLTWDQAPEAIKLEIETLFDIIYTVTQTPNITFKEMKGVGNLSGIAIKLMFMDAHSKAKDKQDDTFGECIQRRINLIKAGMAKVDVTLESAVNLTITPKFGLFMPDNEVEDLDIEEKKINNILAANGNLPIIGHEQSLVYSPFQVDDQKANWKALQAQQLDEKVELKF